MKHFMLITILGSLFIGSAFAAQTTTDCPWMNGTSRGGNPKANLEAKTVKKPSKGSVATGQ